MFLALALSCLIGVRSSEVATSNLAEVPLGISTTMLTEVATGAEEGEEDEAAAAALRGTSCHGLTSTATTPPPPPPPSPLATAVTKTRASAVRSTPALRME